MSMIRLRAAPPSSLDEARAQLQTAIGVELGTLPPYLYALYSIRPGTNAAATESLHAVVLEEMVHMCLACNILNAIGGQPEINPMVYPSPLPGDIGPDGDPLTLHLYPFSAEAMDQGMKIEQPDDPPDFPVAEAAAAPAVSIGEFYTALDGFLATLPESAWTPNRNQLRDDQFLRGRIFAVNSYDDAGRAITQIVAEGEGTRKGTEWNPLDLDGELAHYFRFGEMFHDLVLTRIPDPPGYAWGPEPFGIDRSGVHPAIADPARHDFSGEPDAARQAQDACNAAFTAMVDALRLAVTGQTANGHAGTLGIAVRAMFDLRMAARHAFTVPLADGTHVAGPAFVYQADGGVR